MNNLKFFLTIAALGCSILTFSQTEKGKMLIGGTAGFDIQFEDPDDVVSIDFSPGLGFFVIDNLAVGGALSVSYSKAGDFSATGFGISPFGRYYFGAGMTKIFLQAQGGYVTAKVDFGGGNDNTGKGYVLQGGPGVALFLNEFVAIEGMLAYTKTGGDFDTSDLGLRFGVQAYFGGGE